MLKSRLKRRGRITAAGSMKGKLEVSAMQAAIVKRVGILGITLLVLLVPFGGYYLSYVSSQRDYYRSKNLRVLSAIANQIGSRVRGVGRSVQNAANKAASDLNDDFVQAQRDQAEVKSPRPQSPRGSAKTTPTHSHQSLQVENAEDCSALFEQCGISAEGRAKLAIKLEAKLKSALQPISEQAGTPMEYVAGTLRVSWCDPVNDGKMASQDATAPLMSMRLDADERVIRLSYSRRSDPAFSFDVKYRLNREGSKSGLLGPIIERYIFDEMPDPSQHLFEAVVIADQNDGKVIYQEGRVPPTLANLKGLISAGDGKEIDIHQHTSTIHNVRLAGSDYKLFMEPLQLPFSTDQSGDAAHTDLTVAGLIGEDRFSNQTFSISYNFLLGVGGILLLSCMSWPLLKVLLMGPNDRLRPVDMVGVCVSALLSVALVTLIALDFYAYSALDGKANEQLRDLGNLVDKNVCEELADARRQLNLLNEANPDFNNLPGKLVRILDPGSGSQMPPAADPDAVPYPYFNEANWIDSKTGQQQIKWTTRADTRSFIKVSDRTYFLKARRGEFCVDSVSSRTSGEKMAVISIPVKSGAGVLSIGTRLLSLFDTVLPPGFGYAIVDEEGTVIFHSDAQKNREENLLEECSDSRRLRAAILAGSALDFGTQYVGRDHHFYVRPLSGSKWTVVAFRDKRILRTVNLQMLFHWLMLLMIYGSIQTAVLSAILLPALHRRSAWLWPNKERSDLYRAALVLSAILALLLTLSVALTSGWTMVLIAMIFPWCGLILVKLTLEGRARTAGRWLLKVANWASLRPRSFRMGYALVWTSMLALAGVLPALAFFNASYQVEITKFTKHAQMRIARSLQERSQRIEDYCKSLFASNDVDVQSTRPIADAGGIKGGQIEQLRDGRMLKRAAEAYRDGRGATEVNQIWIPQDRAAARAAMLERRASVEYDNYSSILLRTKTEDPEGLPESDGGVDALLSGYIPLFDQTSAETLDLTHSQSADGSWLWRRGTGNKLWLQRKTAGPGSPITLVSEVPVMIQGASPVWWLLMTPFVLIAVGLCYLISRFVGRRVMLLDVVDPMPLLPEPLGSSPISEHTLVLQRAGERAGITWNEEVFTIIRLREFDVRYAEERLKNLSTPAVVIDHFDDRAYDPDATMQKLRLIEALIYQNKTVIAVSTIDPLRFAIPESGSRAVADRAIAAGAARVSEVEETGSTAVQRLFNPPPSEASCRERWVAIFDKFVGIHALQPANTITSDDPPARQFYDSMRAGKQPWPYLEKICRQVVEFRTAATPQVDCEEMKECLLERVSEMARPYHLDIWENCSRDERIALFDLADDGLINGGNLELKQLMRRGLIVRDPAPCLMDESFRRFVVTQGRKEDLISRVRDCRSSPWQNSKLPLLLIFVAMAGFLLLTQREMYESTITFVSTLSGGALALFKLLDVFGKGKIANPAQG
jgi:hypothetical protein